MEHLSSGVVTPEREIGHSRTDSFESTSSGHSSGSEFLSRRRPIFPRFPKETPIEKEIRLAKEREEELKRDKMNLSASCIEPVMTNPVKTQVKTAPSFIETPKKEPNYYSGCEGAIKKCMSLNSLDRDVNVHKNSPLWNSAIHYSNRNLLNQSSNPPKVFTVNKNQKGVMKRFIDSHGRMAPTFNLAGLQPAAPKSAETSQTQAGGSSAKYEVEKRGISSTSRRPGYISAEDKIQLELREMRKREAELRKERARAKNRSQPNLPELDLGEYTNEKTYKINQQPTINGGIKAATSNPNLTEKTPSLTKTPRVRRRSALIDAWEKRIRKEN